MRLQGSKRPWTRTNIWTFRMIQRRHLQYFMLVSMKEWKGMEMGTDGKLKEDM